MLENSNFADGTISTQCDNIGAKFVTISRMPSQRIDYLNAEQLLLPHRKGARDLKLARSFRRYAWRCADMGASHVVAVDISSGTIEAAKAASISSQ